MPIPGSVQVTGFIAPTDTSDTYATHDALYGRGGHRSVAALVDLDTIPADRRTEGMLVYVDATAETYRLLPAPWTYAFTDWTPAFISDPTLGGDLSGTASAATVIGIQGVPVVATAPTSGQTLVYNGVTNQYEPRHDPQYFISGAAAQAAAGVTPFVNGTTIVIYPG